MSDILWADPMKNENASEDFKFNEDRGTSCQFNSRPLKALLKKQKMQTMLRAHEVQDQGYKFHWLGSDGYPACITIFSAPNYCGNYGNKGAVVCSMPDNIEILTFEENQSKPVVHCMPFTDP